MRMNVTVELNLKTKEVTAAMAKAAREAMRDTVFAITRDAQQHSPKATGTNMNSIKYEASGFLVGEGIVDQSKIQGAVYSTSGYGGWLEVGTGIFGPAHKMITPVTAKMLVWEGKGGELIFAKAVKGIPARPYFKPAFDRNKDKFPEHMKRHLAGVA